MIIRTITYARLVKTAQFENRRLEMTAELSEDDNVDDCYEALRDTVDKALGVPTEDDRKQAAALLREHEARQERIAKARRLVEGGEL